MFDLAGADTEGESSEGTVGGSVAVTTDNGGTGKGEALLWADNVDDTLALVTKAEVGETEVLNVLFQGDALRTGVVLLDERCDVLEGFARGCRNVLQRDSGQS